MRIWKWTLTAAKKQTLELPAGSKLLTVQEQCGEPRLWALCDDQVAKTEPRHIAIYSTGGLMPDDPGSYIGSFQLDRDFPAFHVFEAAAKEQDSRGNGKSGERSDSTSKQPEESEACLQQLKQELDKARAANNLLRAMLPKLNAPCVYCGGKEITKCPHGFPGCPQADDLVAGGDEVFIRVVKERNEAVKLHAQAVREREAAERETNAMLEKFLKEKREHEEAKGVPLESHPECLWTWEYDYWQTQCGGTFCFEDDPGDPAWNDHKFCPKCGKLIKPVGPKREEDGDE